MCPLMTQSRPRIATRRIRMTKQHELKKPESEGEISSTSVETGASGTSGGCASGCKCKVKISPRPRRVSRTGQPDGKWDYQILCIVAPAASPCLPATLTVTNEVLHSDGTTSQGLSADYKVTGSPHRQNLSVKAEAAWTVGDTVTITAYLAAGDCLSEDSIQFLVV